MLFSYYTYYSVLSNKVGYDIPPMTFLYGFCALFSLIGAIYPKPKIALQIEPEIYEEEADEELYYA